MLMKKIYAFIIIIFLTGCGVPKNLRTFEDKDSAIIGISIKTITLSIFKNKPDVVYFVKLDEKDENNLGNKIIPSNYTRGNYAYLINAKPGKYAVAGSFFTQTDNSYNTFFDADALGKSVIDVGPGRIVYAGNMVIENNMKSLYHNIEQNGDKTQLHYYNLLKTYMYGTFYCGSLIKAEKSVELEKEFLLKSKDYFKDTDWVKLIDNDIQAISK
jgi:hypothetical protein